jgi:hypothetical protein
VLLCSPDPRKRKKTQQKQSMTKTKQNNIGKDHHSVVLNNGSSSELVGERLACSMYCVLCADKRKNRKKICW